MAKNLYIVSPFVDLAKWILSAFIVSSALAFVVIKTNSCNVGDIKDCAYRCAEVSVKKKHAV